MTEHHTLHWTLLEPPSKSSNYSKWALCHQRCKGCWRIGCFDGELVQQGRRPGRRQGGRPRRLLHPSLLSSLPTEGSRGILLLLPSETEGCSSFHIRAVFCRVTTTISVMVLLTRQDILTFWKDCSFLVVFYYQQPQDPLPHTFRVQLYLFWLWQNACLTTCTSAVPESASQATTGCWCKRTSCQINLQTGRVVYWFALPPTLSHPELFLSEDNKASRK